MLKTVGMICKGDVFDVTNIEICRNMQKRILAESNARFFKQHVIVIEDSFSFYRREETAESHLHVNVI